MDINLNITQEEIDVTAGMLQIGSIAGDVINIGEAAANLLHFNLKRFYEKYPIEAASLDQYLDYWNDLRGLITDCFIAGALITEYRTKPITIADSSDMTIEAFSQLTNNTVERCDMNEPRYQAGVQKAAETAARLAMGYDIDMNTCRRLAATMLGMFENGIQYQYEHSTNGGGA